MKVLLLLLDFAVAAVFVATMNWLSLIPFRRTKGHHWTERARKLYVPVPIARQMGSLPEMLDILKDLDIYGVLCDHRLTDHPYANFNGAEAVSTLVSKKKLGLLVTDYTTMDLNSTIRLHRRNIPVLIPGGELRPAILAPAFQTCEREVIYGELPTSRKPRRSIVLVNKLTGQQEQTLVEAFVPQWNLHEAVAFPLELVPCSLRQNVQAGVTLIAGVNIDAESPADLYFENFELPSPDDLE